MKKSLLIVFIIVIFIFVACDNNEEINNVENIYIQTIEKLIEEDSGLNDDIKYIAIDFSTFEALDKNSKEEIIKYIEKNYMNVKDSSLEELKAEGEFDEENLYLKKGILIKIEKISKFTSNEISFEASKYRSGLGAIGLEFKFKKKNEKWQMIKSDMIWIS